MCEYQERALVEQAERALVTDSPPVTAPPPDNYRGTGAEASFKKEWNAKVTALKENKV